MDFIAHQAPLSMGFSRQEFWSGLPHPSPGDLPDLGTEPGFPSLWANSLSSEPPRKPEKYSHTSHTTAAFILASGHLGLEMKILYHCTLYSESERKVKVKIAQSCLTVCNPMDCIVHGVLQARRLEWVAYPFCSRSSPPRDWTGVSCIAGGFFTNWAVREAHSTEYYRVKDTKAQPLVEDACTWGCTPDTWTHLRDWTRKCTFTSLNVYNLKVRM